MLLFISSSKKKFQSFPVVSTMLCVAILLVIYDIALWYWQPHFDYPLNQWSNNRIKMERFLYGAYQTKAVLVGSSLSAAFEDDSLGTAIYNLGLSGDSALTGLEIIERRGIIPGCIIVEINSIERTANREVLDEIFARIPYGARKYFLALRQEYRPDNLLLNTLFPPLDYVRKGLFARGMKLLGRLRGTDGRIGKPPQPDENLLETWLALQRRTMSVLPDDSEFQGRLEKIKTLVIRLKEKGSCIVFLEMPIHPELMQSVRFIAVRQRLLSEFNPKQYWWITFDSSWLYQTSDGLHLKGEDLHKVGGLIRKDVEQILAQKAQGSEPIYHSHKDLKS